MRNGELWYKKMNRGLDRKQVSLFTITIDSINNYQEILIHHYITDNHSSYIRASRFSKDTGEDIGEIHMERFSEGDS